MLVNPVALTASLGRGSPICAGDTETPGAALNFHRAVSPTFSGGAARLFSDADMAGTSTSIISALALSLLAACGGGGGSDKAADPGTTPAVPAAAAPAPNPATPAGNQPDPLYASQWHLKNTGQAADAGPAATAGQDVNVEPVWNSCNDNGSCKGEGIAIAVVDRGVEIAHPDLQPNLSNSLAGRVYSLNGAPANGDPTPVQTDRENAHGTAVAGIVAARDNNGLGGRGVAPRATFTGYALLQASTNSNEADAMAFQAKDVAVSNNSWGPADGNGQLSDANSLWRDAIEFGLASGRNGLGTIYVWAAGNGYNSGFKERSTYDGYASYRGVIAVGALNAQGRRSSYSEPGANVWVSAPGGEQCAGGLAILTTDLSGAKGYNTGAGAPELGDADYTRCMNGTSAAVPSVSGVMALMLQANPALGWRDARAVLARSARQTDPADASWKTNGAGRRISDTYGFGAVDAKAAVDAARGWVNLPAQKVFRSPAQAVNLPVPDNAPTGVSSTLTVAGSGVTRIEWVDLVFNAPSHPYSGDLRIVLTSPSGTELVLADTHFCDGRCVPYDGWRFGIAHLLDEAADGTWKISVQDGAADDVGKVDSWQLTVYGH